MENLTTRIKTKLVNDVISQMVIDISENDFTAIFELLMSIENVKLNNYLPNVDGYLEAAQLTEKDVKKFLKNYGIKVKKNESCDYVELMMDNHICIEWWNKQYYIPEDICFNDVDKFIYDILNNDYHV